MIDEVLKGVIVLRTFVLRAFRNVVANCADRPNGIPQEVAKPLAGGVFAGAIS
jgi:hypothetical protein